MKFIETLFPNIEVRGFRQQRLMKTLNRIAWGLFGLSLAVYFIPNLEIQVIAKLVMIVVWFVFIAYGVYRYQSVKAIPESDRNE